MKTRTQIAVEAYLSGDVKVALKIASDFQKGITKEEHKALKLGYEAIVYPGIYTQMKVDVAKAIAKARSIFENSFMMEVA